MSRKKYFTLGSFILFILGLIVLLNSTVLAGDKKSSSNYDWPQWRGPNRNGISYETDLITSFSNDVPTVLWKQVLGDGYSGIAVKNDKVYTMYDESWGQEYVICLEADSGHIIWLFAVDDYFLNREGAGPRSTPTVDGDKVFVLSATGLLYALNADSGYEIWEVDLQKELGAKRPRYGFAASPLVEGELLLIEVGRNSKNEIVALNKNTGKLVWRTWTLPEHFDISNYPLKSDRSGYSSPVAVNLNGVRQILFLTGNQLLSISPEGKIYWRFPWKTYKGANVASPVVIPENKIFISSGYDKGAVMLKIHGDKKAFEVQKIWQSKIMRNRISTAICYNGYLFGFDRKTLKCIDVYSGFEMWKKKGFGMGNIFLADNHLFIFSERGKLVIADATHTGYRELTSVKVLSGKCWTPPSLANGKLFARNQYQIICIDLIGENNPAGSE
ncbi:MAG: PQQ-binding-like beta-propeller repeat protein [bacterium]